MKAKWNNILFISCLAASVIVSVCTVSMNAKCLRYHVQTEQRQPLQPGDLVQHKLNKTWKGLVIDNPDGPKVNLRWTVCGSSSYQNDTYEIEWERE